jgi:hypothetical protein
MDNAQSNSLVDCNTPLSEPFRLKLILVSACSAQPPVGAVGVMQLSEPLLWFILRVIDKESALEEFNRMGGVRVCINHIILQNLKTLVSEQMVLQV